MEQQSQESAHYRPSSSSSESTWPLDEQGNVVDEIGYCSDVEGSLAYWTRYVQLSRVLSFSDDGQQVILHDRKAFVFGGDLFDKGPGDLRLAASLVSLKERYPTRVFLIIGNRDLNKTKLTSELEPAEVARGDNSGPYWVPEKDRVTPLMHMETEHSMHGDDGKRTTGEKTNMCCSHTPSSSSSSSSFSSSSSSSCLGSSAATPSAYSNSAVHDKTPNSCTSGRHTSRRSSIKNNPVPHQLRQQSLSPKGRRDNSKTFSASSEPFARCPKCTPVISRLRYILTHTMGAPEAFEHRRFELLQLQTTAGNLNNSIQLSTTGLSNSLASPSSPSSSSLSAIGCPSPTTLPSSPFPSSPMPAVPAVSDHQVLSSFLSSLLDKDGCVRRYLLLAQIGLCLGNTLFVHGGITDLSMGFFPTNNSDGIQEVTGEDMTGEEFTVQEWIARLNQWASEEIFAWTQAPYYTKDRKRAGSALMGYGYHAAMKGRTVIVQDMFKHNNPHPASAKVCEYLSRSGITRLIVGHKPYGDSPGIMSQPQLQVLVADTSFSDPSSPLPCDTRGAAVHEICIQGQARDNVAYIHGVLRTSRSYAFALPNPATFLSALSSSSSSASSSFSYSASHACTLSYIPTPTPAVHILPTTAASSSSSPPSQQQRSQQPQQVFFDCLVGQRVVCPPPSAITACLQSLSLTTAHPPEDMIWWIKAVVDNSDDETAEPEPPLGQEEKEEVAAKKDEQVEGKTMKKGESKQYLLSWALGRKLFYHWIPEAELLKLKFVPPFA